MISSPMMYIEHAIQLYQTMQGHQQLGQRVHLCLYHH